MKKTLFYKLLVILLCITLLALSVVSCGKDENSDISGENQNAETFAETQSYDPELPEGINFGGYTFVIAINSGNIDRNFIDRETLNGVRLNDTIYERNSYIEEKYNCKIDGLTLAGSDNWTQTGTMDALIMAGDISVDITLPILVQGVAMYLDQDNLVDLKLSEYLNFDKPWWDTNCIDQIYNFGKIYLAGGDFNMTNYERAWGLFFNYTLLNNYNLELPYTHVKNGTWTFDTFKQMCIAVSTDLNGDGIWTGTDDIYGYLPDDDIPFAVLINSGYNLIGKDPETGYPVFDLMNERVYKILEDWTVFIQQSPHISPGMDYNQYSQFASYFSSDHALFMSRTLDMALQLGDMSSDYGIVTHPKFDENQEKYGNFVNQSGTYIAIPKTVKNFDNVCMFIEAMSARSSETVLPVFYEQTLCDRYMRDSESVEQLRIILSNLSYNRNLTVFSPVGGIIEEIFFNGAGAASSLASIEEATKTRIQDVTNVITARVSEKPPVFNG